MDKPCPFCNKTLFRIRPFSEDALDVPAIDKDDPHLQHEDGVDFVICHHCGKRVIMEAVAGGPSGTQFRISDNQS